MQIISRGLLLIICLGITVECQGGGGGGGGGGFSGGGAHYGRGTRSSCKSDNCYTAIVITASIVGGIVALVVLICGIHYCTMRRKKATTQSGEQEKSAIGTFQTGYWKSRYFQYGKWHSPSRFSLRFDSQLMQITGSGLDDVGKFTINGVYCTETNRMGLTKKYQAGTGNRSENLGHQVTIQLIWNARNNQFEGKWYVRTNKYHGSDKFELTFDGQHLLTVYEKV